MGTCVAACPGRSKGLAAVATPARMLADLLEVMGNNTQALLPLLGLSVRDELENKQGGQKVRNCV